MILVDTSAWVAFLRGTDSPARTQVRELLRRDELATCEVVRMEVLAGARDEGHLHTLQGTFARATLLSIVPTDYDDAAALYRHCRRRGTTIRQLLDCLIAAVAIRNGVPVLHDDRDFDALARHAELEVYRIL